jgi:hypothetical protein
MRRQCLDFGREPIALIAEVVVRSTMSLAS